MVEFAILFRKNTGPIGEDEWDQAAFDLPLPDSFVEEIALQAVLHDITIYAAINECTSLDIGEGWLNDYEPDDESKPRKVNGKTHNKSWTRLTYAGRSTLENAARTAHKRFNLKRTRDALREDGARAGQQAPAAGCAHAGSLGAETGQALPEAAALPAGAAAAGTDADAGLVRQ